MLLLLTWHILQNILFLIQLHLPTWIRLNLHEGSGKCAHDKVTLVLTDQCATQFATRVYCAKGK